MCARGECSCWLALRPSPQVQPYRASASGGSAADDPPRTNGTVDPVQEERQVRGVIWFCRLHVTAFLTFSPRARCP